MNNIRERRTKTGIITGCLLALLLIFAMSVHLAKAEGTHPVTIQYDLASISGTTVGFDVYKVGTFSGNNVELDSPFNESGVTIVLQGDGSSSSEQAASAQTLYHYIKAKNIGEDVAQHLSTDDEGNITFQGQDGCIYLIGTEEKIEYGGNVYIANPIFMTVGGGTADEADLKSTETEQTGDIHHTVNTGNLEVTKHWTGDSQETRPASIEVELYEDNEFRETVTLNASNNWTYTWEDNDGEGSWTFVEKVPEGYSYTVLSTSDGAKDLWIITNTARKDGDDDDFDVDKHDSTITADDDNPNGDDSKAKKKKKTKKTIVRGSSVRTGDPTSFRWAIIAMALSGFALIVVAVRRKREE
jgi:hypothetical protein